MVIALKKENFELIRKELQYIGLLFLLALVIFKIAFFRESILVLARSVLSLFWLFVLPGYSIMLFWKEKLGFTERFAVGILLSAAVIGVFSYYVGLMGLNIKYHAVILPLVMVLAGIIINFRR